MLRLDRMKAEYGVGIGTLREILSRLSAEGLVIAEGQRGFEVPPVTAQNLRELAALRLLLDSHALGQSFAAGDTEWDARCRSRPQRRRCHRVLTDHINGCIEYTLSTGTVR